MMKFLRFSSLVLFLAAGAAARAAESASTLQPANDILEHFVDWLQWRIFPDGAHSDLIHWIACGGLFLAAILLRRVVTNIIFRGLKKLSEKTETTLDDKLYPALEQPVAAFIMVLGIFGALTVLKLSPAVDALISHGAIIAILAVLFWGLVRAGGAVLDHLEDMAHDRQIGIAHFMPLIKKALAALVIVFGVLMGIKSLGVDVGAVLTGLGIGGLAFAFAAQDTIANLFGSFVVVLDHPFKVGDYIRIGSAEGTVEDIGLRSTRLRSAARTQLVLPNKTAAAEVIVNFTRMPQRRVDQKIGLTYATTPEQMEAILEDIRKILREDPGVHQEFVTVNFTDYSDSSLDIQIAYFTADPDFKIHLAVRERINLKIMGVVAARGLSFAFPTRTLQFEGELANRMAGIGPQA
ncbi:MAG TPA: mechanosensitive ion channel family protein [Opitutaceae bacterium]|nr:mechanosensitive ion channel family protein [Opitutaceae bacterium]